MEKVATVYLKLRFLLGICDTILTKKIDIDNLLQVTK